MTCLCCQGLFCSVTIVFVSSVGIYEKFASAFIKAVQSLKVGNGLEESTSQVHNCVSIAIKIIELITFGNMILIFIAQTNFMECLFISVVSIPNVTALKIKTVHLLDEFIWTNFASLLCAFCYTYMTYILEFIYSQLRISISFNMQGPLINEAAVQKV